MSDLTALALRLLDQDQDDPAYPLLEAGRHRVVFALDASHVLKVAQPGSEYQNLAEARRWADASPAFRSILAPVVSCDQAGRWLVMRRGEPFTESDWDTDEPTPVEFRGLARTARRHGIRDLYGPNLATLEGRTVLIDYAD